MENAERSPPFHRGMITVYIGIGIALLWVSCVAWARGVGQNSSLDGEEACTLETVYPPDKPQTRTQAAKFFCSSDIVR